jgi:hypothetical protein
LGCGAITLRVAKVGQCSVKTRPGTASSTGCLGTPMRKVQSASQKDVTSSQFTERCGHRDHHSTLILLLMLWILQCGALSRVREMLTCAQDAPIMNSPPARIVAIRVQPRVSVAGKFVSSLLFCSTHRREGDVDVKGKRCKFPHGCLDAAKYGLR